MIDCIVNKQMVFRYQISPLPPVISICLKDVHLLQQ